MRSHYHPLLDNQEEEDPDELIYWGESLRGTGLLLKSMRCEDEEIFDVREILYRWL